MTPTHILALGDGYGSTRLVELVNSDQGLSLVRLYDHCYWEKPHVTTRVVRTAALTEIKSATA